MALSGLLEFEFALFQNRLHLLFHVSSNDIERLELFGFAENLVGISAGVREEDGGS
jgi:hypothetical protein